MSGYIRERAAPCNSAAPLLVLVLCCSLLPFSAALSRIGVGQVYTIGLIEALVAGVLGIALLGECVAGTQATACPDSSSA